MDGVAAGVRAIAQDLVALRRALHRQPELAFQEVKTASRISGLLARHGLAVREGVGGTGVLAELNGSSPGGRLLVRAEMDGLPIREVTDRAYASRRPDVMHACGHDAHMAAVIGAAMILADLRDTLAGSIRFCFQPAEETLAGAEAMIRDGALEGVDHALGGHVLTALAPGMVAVVPGAILAGADFFELAIVGRAGHGGMPESTIDPVLAAAHVVTALQAIVARETRPTDRLVVSITAIEGGSSPNVGPERVLLRGNIRWFSDQDRQRTLARIDSIGVGVSAALRASAELRVIASTPVSVNAAAELDVVKDAVAATQSAIAIDSGAITASDDWARFSERVPAAFFFLGAGGSDAAPHHHPAFDIDESSIPVMCEILVRTALAHARHADGRPALVRASATSGRVEPPDRPGVTV